MSLRRSHAALAIPLAFLLLLGACADKPAAWLNTVSFTVAPAANDSTPVAIDVVSIRDKALVDQLTTLTAADWFAKREQYRRDHPSTLDIASWELVPGQKLDAQLLSDREAAWAILVYANYATPGPHRLRAPDTRTLSLSVGDKDVELAP
ncbi:hypothetical protein [Azospirillum palustre]